MSGGFDHVQPVAHPFGFAVAHEHDLHAARSYGPTAARGPHRSQPSPPIACRHVRSGCTSPAGTRIRCGGSSSGSTTGRVWTGDVSTNGLRYVDPLGTRSGPAAIRHATDDRRRAAGSGLALASMILGIVAVSIAWMPFIVAVGAVVRRAGHRVRRHLAGASRDGSRRSQRGARLRHRRPGHRRLAAACCAWSGCVLSVAVLRAVDRFDNPAANEVDGHRLRARRVTVATMIGTIDQPPIDVAPTSASRSSFTRPGTDNAHRDGARRRRRRRARRSRPSSRCTRQVASTTSTATSPTSPGRCPFGVETSTERSDRRRVRARRRRQTDVADTQAS